MKKILFYTNIPSPYRVDFFNELGKYCDLTVLFETSHSTERVENWEKEVFENFHGIIMNGKKTAADMAFCPKIVKYLKKGQYDHIVVCLVASYTAMLAVAWMRLLHIPYWYEADGSFLHQESKLKYWLKKFVISGAEKWFSTSDAFDEYCLHYGAIKEDIVRYPFTSIRDGDVLDHVLSKEEKNVIKEKLNIESQHMLISVGRIIQGKGFDILLNAIDVLDDTWTVYIVGGDPTDDLIDLMKKNHISNVTFVPFMQTNDLYEYYKAADLFVLPTRSDVWGLVVNEAMAKGIPVVTTRQCTAGLEMVEEEKNGYLYDCEDVDALRRILDKLTNDSERLHSMSQESLKMVRNYTLEAMVDVHCRVMLAHEKGDH